MRKRQTILQTVFWIIAAADIAGNMLNMWQLHYFVKPLLMPALILVVSTIKTASGKKIILAALFFSWLGDVFLLYENNHSLFFIFGLASFLTTHILYIFYFTSIKPSAVSLLKKQPMLIAAVLLYGISLIWLVFPKLGSLKIAVMIYAAVICAMLLCSMHVFYKVPKKAAWLFLSGALLFVLSDTALALNKFYQPYAMAGVVIMLTYCAAQYNIVCGFIKQQLHD